MRLQKQLFNSYSPEASFRPCTAYAWASEANGLFSLCQPDEAQAWVQRGFSDACRRAAWYSDKMLWLKMLLQDFAKRRW